MCASLAALLTVLAIAVAAALPALGAITFNDVPPGHAYASAIADLATRGIVEGFDDGTYRPEAAVTRQQFAKLVVLTAGWPATEADVCPFPDVEIGGPGILYPDHYVAVAAARHVTEGRTALVFAPAAAISRAQVITMVVRAADALDPSLLDTIPPGYNSTWDPSFSSDHGQNTRRAESNGLLSGLPAASTRPPARR